ncbi:minor capsid protein [Dactylosporangium sp. NPDC000521]|uniref:minor capsid protein n=1 Tax=Dactylosporangium sp. NPDC000521 TaxID=3363975 RepID=UPI00367B442F
MIGDGWTSRLLTGMAEHLAAAGIAQWRPDGPAYLASETGILVRAVPPQPDRVITLAAYPIATTRRGLADHDTGVQVRLRGDTDPRDCDDLADAVFEELDGATNLTWGGVRVVQIGRASYTSLGQDGNGRWERSENYYLQTMRPTAHNPD